jgi:hypothetical protein
MFVPVWSEGTKRRRLRKWLYDVPLPETFAEWMRKMEAGCVPPVLHQPAWTIDAYLNNSPLKSARFRRQTIHACPPVVSMLVLWTPFESSQALSAVFRRAKRHESKRRTYEFRATIPYASAWMHPSFTMQCGGVLKENARVLLREPFA